MSEPKKYGLQLNKKAAAKALLVKKPSVFGDDSDEEDATKELNKKLLDEAAKAKVKKTTKLAIEKALNEDASVYEYDSLYDDMQAKKQAKVGLKKTNDDNKPKYIHNLLKSAELRKKEYERRVERTVQKEREEEGDKFADKESFVTSAYKKKMEEIAAAEEKERQEAQMEDMLDVTRQGNLNAFYHNLYRTTTDDEPAIKKEKIDDDPPIKKEKPDDNEDEGRETVEKEPEKQRDATFSSRRPDKRDGEKRKYRSRRHSSTNSIGDKQRDSDDDTNQNDITRKAMEDLDKDDSESDNDAKEESNESDTRNIKNGVRQRKNERKQSSSGSDSDDNSDESKHRKQSKSLKKHKNNENRISTPNSDHDIDSNDDKYPKVAEATQNKENTQPKPMTLREKYARKTTDAEIEAARQRYFLRKQARA